MKIETLKERIEKKQAQIERKYNTIAKKKAQIEKKAAKARALGYDPEEGEANARGNHEAYWLICDIEHLKEDIRRGYDEIEECKATLEKYEKQLAGELEKEALFINEVPQAMKDLEAKLIDKWNEDDKRRRDYLKGEYKRLEDEHANERGCGSYKDFIKAYGYSAYGFMFTSDEEIHKGNVKDARAFILDLVNRVKEITGEVVSWEDVRLTAGNVFPVLNGTVEGKEGTARVESILAGGYNIQRLHIRTLVKAC